MSANADVLLVIPCFRESGRIGSFIADLHRELGSDPSVHVLPVDDGSGGDEPNRLRAIIDAQRPSWPALHAVYALPQNQGKGGAIYSGWAQHTGESWLAFVDADGSCSASEVRRLIGSARSGTSAVLGSRVKMLGREIHRHFHRHLLGRIYATIVGTLLEIPVYDSQCGLKIIPRTAFERIRPMLSLHGFAFDVELLCALWDSGCPMREDPIHWHEVPGGHVRLVKDSLNMFRDVLTVRAARSSSTWRKTCQSDNQVDTAPHNP